MPDFEDNAFNELPSRSRKLRGRRRDRGSINAVNRSALGVEPLSMWTLRRGGRGRVFGWGPSRP